MDSLNTSLAPQTELPERVRAWIDRDGGDHALLLITVDGYLRPHVMMLARDEVAVISGSVLRIAASERSQSAQNMRLRASATLAIYAADLACVIKTRVTARPRPLVGETSAVELAIEDIRFDKPTAAEASARLVTGLRFEGRAPRLDIRQLLATMGA